MLTTGQIWDAITRVGRLSHSITSGNNRMLRSVFYRKASLVGEQNASLRDSINARVEKSIDDARDSSKKLSTGLESDTGKVVDSSG